MVQCWRKLRNLGVEPGQYHTAHIGRHMKSVRNEHGTTKGEASV
jgi:hypothetical protein